MRAIFDRKFSKQHGRAQDQIKRAFEKRLALFLQKPSHPLLRNHELIGQYTGCRSINITGDWRAIYQELDGGKTAYFFALGTHSQLYR